MQNKDLLLDSYDYVLEPHRIATRPVEGRHNSKLLVYNAKSNEITHTHFHKLADFLSRDNLLMMNQSRVFPCRLFGQKPSGGKVELFLLSLIPEKSGLYPAMIKTSGKKKIDDLFHFDDLTSILKAREDDGTFLVEFNLNHDELISFLETKANIPIPPYIRDGIADEKDLTDYQTVYAKELGSVAAPTAGLHFTQDVFDSLEQKNIDRGFVTLHVGAGTFKPVTSDHILEHKMHKEHFDITDENLKKLNSQKKIIAVGTTTLRVLESTVIKSDSINFTLPEYEKPYGTDIFMYPGKEVKSISGLLTNFHLPKSSLIMLVSAIIGREKTLELYEEAKAHDYRFFSYGDAMLILR